MTRSQGACFCPLTFVRISTHRPNSTYPGNSNFRWRPRIPCRGSCNGVRVPAPAIQLVACASPTRPVLHPAAAASVARSTPIPRESRASKAGRYMAEDTAGRVGMRVVRTPAPRAWIPLRKWCGSSWRCHVVAQLERGDVDSSGVTLLHDIARHGTSRLVLGCQRFRRSNFSNGPGCHGRTLGLPAGKVTSEVRCSEAAARGRVVPTHCGPTVRVIR